MANIYQNNRKSFGKISATAEIPDLLEVQINSFREFVQLDTPPDKRKNEGLYKVFLENFPVTDARDNFVLDFVDYSLEPPRYTIEECKERGLTYAVALKAKLHLTCKDEDSDFEPTTQEVYLGNIPYMTDSGTFIVNGAERVIVSQLHRSPGVFFGQSIHPNGAKLYSARIIPFKGSWIEFSTDVSNVMYAYIDGKKKFPITTLLRAIGYSTDKDILEIFDLSEEIKTTREELAKAVGRRLAARVIKNHIQDFVDEDTGEVMTITRTEVILERDKEITEADIDLILDSGEKSIIVLADKPHVPEYSIIINTLQKDNSNSESEAVNMIYRQLRNADAPDEETAKGIIDKLFFSDKRYDLGEVGRFRLNKKLHHNQDERSQVLTKHDIISIVKYLIELLNSKANVDDIDHLSNRRVRTVGEQLAAQFSVGLSRMARTIRERMNIRDHEEFKPGDLINARTLSSVINSFFGTSQLSQFLDQTNPLSEITHKRRISALGPGGLSREHAGFEVRDVHYSHYGRLCPIETPEGPNIGLISSLCIYAKVNSMGFIETPYYRVFKGKLDASKMVYLTAEEEDGKTIAQATGKYDENGTFTVNRLKARNLGDFPVSNPEELDYMDVAPNQIVSLAASLIPFLEHDDANRALMGSNMQRQAVPLLRPEAPIVGTGL
ncbi:MAG: DNA-directed RNA polymerase subunit beta, partial [Bacteroidia bacterium]|nr:DNA-directed RNA polymerase subunit beta [Bacteroidia bacterium]MDW8333957.1 DNA-directed RNA polymerase subunit beta [Bacteroidia bacterium]